MKLCCYCNEVKNIILFYNDKHKKDGKSSRCKKCHKLYLDKNRRRIYEKEYRQKHPEKRKSILANYYKTNKEKHKRVQGKYRKTSRFLFLSKAHHATRRARMKNAFIEHVDYLELYKKNPFCFYCNRPLIFKEVEFDHFIPLALNGKHEKENIRVSCSTCNRKKGAQNPLV